jgi:hypothetical protein
MTYSQSQELGPGYLLVGASFYYKAGVCNRNKLYCSTQIEIMDRQGEAPLVIPGPCRCLQAVEWMTVSSSHQPWAFADSSQSEVQVSVFW